MRFLMGLASLLAMALIAGALYLQWLHWQQFFHTPMPIEKEQVFTVAPGHSFAQVVQDLEKQGLVQQGHWFLYYAKFTGKANQIKAGEYHLKPGVTPEELLGLLVLGKVSTYQVTFLEGWTFAQALKKLQQAPKLKQTLQGLTVEEVWQKIKGNNQQKLPEGMIFPDTYQYPAGYSDLQLLERARRRLEQVLETQWHKRMPELPYQSSYDALIMASIVEKETGQASERAQIAGVFVRRLNKGMRLQTDPTIIYGLGDRFHGDLKRSHLRDKSNPYNTYRIYGLPPTPIALAGKEAIEAALHPAPGDALFFVAKGNGLHQFSATLEEHNAAVRKYQLRK